MRRLLACNGLVDKKHSLPTNESKTLEAAALKCFQFWSSAGKITFSLDFDSQLEEDLMTVE